MKRALLGVGFAAVMVVAPWIAGSAVAAPAGTTFALRCDHNVDAAASLSLWAADGTSLGSIDLISCGPNSGFGNRNRVTMPFDVATVDVTSFTGSWGTQDCAQDAVSLPAKLTCPTDGSPGATLTTQ